MQNKSILLALSGSEQSYQATQVAWSLAKKTNSSLVAQHVVDVRSAWYFFGRERSGFLGSGLYISAYESVCNSLKEIAKKIADKYDAMSESQELRSNCLIDEGDPIDEICKRAQNADLVITGHKPSGTGDCNERFTKQSLAVGLANRCPKPLLVIQGQLSAWTKLKILVSVEHLNFQFISECLKLSDALGLSPELICLASGMHEEPAVKLYSDLRAAHPELADLNIEMVGVGGGIGEDALLWAERPLHVELAAAEGDLFVAPTEQIGSKRITVLGANTEAFLQALPLPSILFFPEENLKSLIVEKSAFDSTQEMVAEHSR
ncbi:hypothetical protein BH10CYA1_BH10CYA1_49910 [soil metagenome]